jgi:hypothetical protein
MPAGARVCELHPSHSYLILYGLRRFPPKCWRVVLSPAAAPPPASTARAPRASPCFPCRPAAHSVFCFVLPPPSRALPYPLQANGVCWDHLPGTNTCPTGTYECACPRCATGTGPCKDGNGGCSAYADPVLRRCKYGSFECFVDTPSLPAPRVCSPCFGSAGEGVCQNPANSVCYPFYVGTAHCPAGTGEHRNHVHARCCGFAVPLLCICVAFAVPLRCLCCAFAVPPRCLCCAFSCAVRALPRRALLPLHSCPALRIPRPLSLPHRSGVHELQRAAAACRWEVHWVLAGH